VLLIMKNRFNDSIQEELPSLWRFAYRLTCSQDFAEDLVQRTVLRGLEKQHQYQVGTKLRSWLFAIMHSIWKNELRSTMIRKNYAFSLKQEATEHYDCVGESSQMLREVKEQVDLLPEAQRTVLLLVSVEGYSYKEAAEILDIAVGTVMSRLSRARMTIGKHFINDEKSAKTMTGVKNEN